MKEIEVKILDIDKQHITTRLKKLGAAKTFSGEVRMVLLDFPDKKLQKKGSFIRIRKVGGRAELCFKGKKEKGKFKTREEIEAITDNFESTLKIFEKVGLRRYYEGKKRRESYKLGKTKFEIDSWPGVPPYIEIEAPTEKGVVNGVTKLGYSMNQATNLSAREVVQLYRKK